MNVYCGEIPLNSIYAENNFHEELISFLDVATAWIYYLCIVETHTFTSD